MAQIVLLLTQYGIALVFLAVLIDEAGLPTASPLVVMSATAFTAHTQWDFLSIVMAGVAGGLVADCAWFFAGRRHGRSLLRFACKISAAPDTCVRKTDLLYGRFGKASLILSKFVPGSGVIAMVLAGATQSSAVEFVVLDTLGLGILVGLSALVGAFFKSAISAVMTVLGDMGTVGAVILFCALGLYAAVRMIQRQIFIHRLRMDRIEISEFLDLVRLGPQPVILDVRAPTVREAGIIPGALFAHPDEVEDLLKEMPKQIEVVVYCSCPNEVSAATAALHLRRAGFQKIRPLAGGYEAWLEATQIQQAS